MNQQSAQGLAALGRGPDTMLVHMAPEEVAGLQALALKHGGTLTINPETGLAEAGFLKNILPMVAGFALGPAGFGLMSSAMAGLTVGGITALTSKSLEKGLMAGLGAYGGSGLGESLMGAGTGALSSAGANAVVPPAAESIVPQAVVPAASSVAPTSAVSATNVAPDILGGTAGELASAYYPTVPATNAAQVVTTTTPTINPADLGVQAGPSTGDFARFDRAYSAELGAQAGPSTGDFARFDRAYSPGLGASQTDKLGAGFNAVTASPGAALEFAKANKMPLAALGIAALSGLDDKKVATPNDPGMIRPYTYARTKVPGAFDRTPNDPLSSRERRYFNEQYTAQTPYRAPGPEYMAEGGPVEAMSDANAIGMNTGYPQADIRTGAYATPYQQPISRNVITGSEGAGVNPYTGQAQFAEGGEVGGYLFDPKTGLYTRPGGQGATTVSPTGGLSGASGESGHYAPLSQQTIDFLDKEAATPGARDARMASVSRAIGTALGLVPGPMGALAGLVNFANRGDLTTLAGGIANLFGGTQAPAPVSERGTYAGVPGELNDAQQFSYDQDAANNAQVGASEQAAANEAAGPSGAGTADGGDGYARGGISHLGDYSDGGRLLRGPGDGVSDSIPAMIGQKQQARLADGEFVVPARIVSELGNGSTEAGARQLYAMMDRIQKARRKTVGKDKVATNSRAAKLLPA